MLDTLDWFSLSDCAAESSLDAVSALTAVDVNAKDEIIVDTDRIPANVLFILLSFVATVKIHLSEKYVFMLNR